MAWDGIKGQKIWHNKITIFDGKKFHSKDEANYYAYLKLRQQSGEISELKCQVPFPLIVNSVTIGKMVLDFTYKENGKEIAFDWKGYATQKELWNWKRKHAEAQYPHWEFKTNLDKEKNGKRIRR